MNKKYWETAPTAEISTGKNVLRWYSEVGRLQVSMPDWADEDGNTKKGKTVAINLDALREADGGIEFLQKVFSDIK